MLTMGMAFAFFACSQTVSGSDDNGGGTTDEFIPGFRPASGDTPSSSGSMANSSGSNSGGNGGSSASPGSSQSGGGEIWTDDSDISSESSDLDVTKYMPDQKMDCTFSLEDDVWQFQNVEADSSVDMTLKFKDNGDLWLDIVTTAPAESEEECEKSAALLSVFGALAAASGETDMVMSGSCDGAMFTMKVQGTADEKYTPEQKREMYEKACK